MGEDEELRSKQKFYWSWKILLKEVSFEAGLQSFKCRPNSNRRDTEFQVVEPNLFGVWNREDGFTSWSKKITCSDKYIGMRLWSSRMRGVTWSTFCLQKTIWVTWFWTLWSFFSRCLGKSTSRELSSSQDHKSRWAFWWWKLTGRGWGDWSCKTQGWWICRLQWYEIHDTMTDNTGLNGLAKRDVHFRKSKSARGSHTFWFVCRSKWNDLSVSLIFSLLLNKFSQSGGVDLLKSKARC